MGTVVEAAKAVAIRLYHLTFYKCGSQWVRDVLADPRIAAHSNHTLTAGGIDLQSQPWPEFDKGGIASPLYSTGPGEWGRVAGPDDRALVVIRDPRDIIVSLVYSVSLSHTPTATTVLLRDPIAAAQPAHRLQIGMFLLAHWSEYLRTWKAAAGFPNVFLSRYEHLTVDLAGEMRRLFEYLHWDVPESVIEAVAFDHSFEQRSGRRPGVENEFSHRRKGVAGDWRNHFDRQLGQLFEKSFPSLLTDLGYEARDDWWRLLPPAAPRVDSNPEYQHLRLLSVLEEHEKELAALREAAAARLSDVEALHGLLHEQTVAATERLADVARLDFSRRQLEESFAWRWGFRPLHAITSLFGK